MNRLMEKPPASNGKIESSTLSSSSTMKMACSLIVRAVTLYAKGCWFESSQVNEIKLWFGVMVTRRSHKPEDVSSTLTAATNDDLAQWLRALR